MPARPPGRVLVAHDDEPVDLVTWRETGRDVGACEAALDANPGLARVGDAAPGGTAIFLPDTALADRPLAAPLVQLWD